MLSALPEIAKEERLALHGGTAINLFVREMPRVSVDIDLTYVHIEDRQTSLQNIAKVLARIKANIEKVDPRINVLHKTEECKLLISRNETVIKVEVNQIMRGVISPVTQMTLCQTAQNEFEAYCEMSVVPMGQLLGGKLCAALDRQHPRDVFDVRYILQEEGFHQDVKTGLVYSLLSSARPLHELLCPHDKDQRGAMENQFEGMTDLIFTYEDFEETRTQLTETIHKNMTAEDKAFLVSFNRTEPDWKIYDFERYPSVRWKLHNLQKLKEAQPDKLEEQCALLERLLLNPDSGERQ